MKTIRLISSNPVVLALVICLLLFTSCSKDNVLDSLPADSEISGEEMFRNIFFLEGSAVGSKMAYYKPAIDRLENLTEEQKKEKQELIDGYISKIAQLDSEYFRTFKKTMLSDDPFAIKEELVKGSKLILSLTGIQSENLEEILGGEITSRYDLSKAGDIDSLIAELETKMNFESKDIPETKAEEAIVTVVVVALAAVVAAAAVIISFVVEVTNLEEPTTAGSSLVGGQFVVAIIEAY